MYVRKLYQYKVNKMRGSSPKSPNIAKLILLAIAVVVLVCLLRRLVFAPCPEVHVIRKTVVVSRDGQTLSSAYTLLSQEEKAALLRQQDAEERERRRGKSPRDVTVEITCDKAKLKAPPTVLETKCGDKCDLLTCGNLLAPTGKDDKFTAKLHQQAKWFKSQYKTRLRSDISLSKLECSSLKSKYGYERDVSTPEEVSFPLAFNLIVHKDSDQVFRLLSSIYRAHNSYCIHIDSKSSANMHAAISKLTECLPNVFISSRLESIVYAGFSRLQADINCMQDQVKSDIKWQYLINLAGQAFPLKSNLELVEILKTYNGHNDIEGLWGRTISSRFIDEYEEIEGKFKPVKTGRKNPPPPHDLKIVRGSAYGTFNRDFVDWLLTDRVAVDLLNWSRRTYSPDEHYWSTLNHAFINPNLNAPGAFNSKPSGEQWMSVYASWGPHGPCHGAWRHGTCIFSSEDVSYLTRERNELFANKFYADKFPIAFDCMEAWIRWKEQCRPPLNIEFYKSLKISSAL